MVWDGDDGRRGADKRHTTGVLKVQSFQEGTRNGGETGARARTRNRGRLGLTELRKKLLRSESSEPPKKCQRR